MAEIAIGVLHNVGNVLNSVNVSATLVLESMQRSKVTGLSKAAELMEMHTADLPRFLYLPRLWSGFAPSSQPLSAQAGRSAMGGSAGCDLARSTEILLR